MSVKIFITLDPTLNFYGRNCYHINKLECVIIACKYQTRVKVNGTGKQSSQRYGNNYDRKTFYIIGPWGLYYKTFYGRNLRIFVKARVFVPGKHFQPSIMFVGEARSLPQSKTPEKVLYSGRLQPCPKTLDQAGKVCHGQTL